MSATVVKPFGFATGDWEGSRCGIRTRIALQNPVAQVVVAILWSHGPFATPGQGGCSLGMHGSPPKRRDKKARRSAAGRPSRRFGPPRRSWGLTRGLTHCVRSRLRRELYHPQRSSETLRLACKIAPICLIEEKTRNGIYSTLRNRRLRGPRQNTDFLRFGKPNCIVRFFSEGREPWFLVAQVLFRVETGMRALDDCPN